MPIEPRVEDWEVVLRIGYGRRITERASRVDAVGSRYEGGSSAVLDTICVGWVTSADVYMVVLAKSMSLFPHHVFTNDHMLDPIIYHTFVPLYANGTNVPSISTLSLSHNINMRGSGSQRIGKGSSYQGTGFKASI
jgi:hypothetical protein